MWLKLINTNWTCRLEMLVIWESVNVGSFTRGKKSRARCSMPLLGLYIHYLENCGNLTQDPACLAWENFFLFVFLGGKVISEAKRCCIYSLWQPWSVFCTETKSSNLADTNLWWNTYTNAHAQSATWWCPPHHYHYHYHRHHNTRTHCPFEVWTWQ